MFGSALEGVDIGVNPETGVTRPMELGGMEGPGPWAIELGGPGGWKPFTGLGGLFGEILPGPPCPLVASPFTDGPAGLGPGGPIGLNCPGGPGLAGPIFIPAI